MTSGRLEAFSDGVVAILMTIMAFGLVPPDGVALVDLVPLWPVFSAYVLSFAILAIYWNNHHHLLQATETVDGRVLWANMLLLFSLSLIPFGTAWIGATNFASIPMAIYGVILLMVALAYYLLVRSLIAAAGKSDAIAVALKSDLKGRLTPWLYAIGIPIALFAPLASFALYVGVAGMWIVPDRRIERHISS